MYVKPPLPFTGNKRNCRKILIDIVRRCNDDTIFVDLFGGSLFCAYVVKQAKPNCRVITNDFDNYRERLEHIEETNQLLAKIRTKSAENDLRASAETQKQIHQILTEHKQGGGFVDVCTLSCVLCFSGLHCVTFEELLSQTIYQRKIPTYDSRVDDYIEGLEIRSCDWKVLFDEFKDNPNVCFICDPPYLYTDKLGYNCKYWRLKNSLEVNEVMFSGRSFIFFTSTKSGTQDLVEFMQKWTNRPLKYSSLSIQRVGINKTVKPDHNVEIIIFNINE